jgi:nucleotide-binding universal stress UspA family protein
MLEVKVMKVLIAVDQSDFRHQILSAVTNRKWPPQTQFKILTIIEPLPFHWEQICYDDWKQTAQEILRGRKDCANKVLAESRAELIAKFADASVHTEIAYGRTVDELIRVATEWSPDKLILGAHGRSPNRLFPSAVTTTVARHAGCSIEIVRLKPLNHEVVSHSKKVKAQQSADTQDTVVTSR